MNTQVVIDAFRARYGSEPEVVGIAPGRINLIGEHTDYSDGFVFPVAIDRGITVAARRTEGLTQLTSLELGDGQAFDAMAALPPMDDWAKFAAGMSWVLRGYGPLPNIEGVVGSDLPIASGVSSSAAIELAFGVVWNHLAQLGLDNKQLAVLGQKCENEFVGVKCGIMDQMASAMGRDSRAMFLDTRSLEIDYAPIPSGLVVALLDTKKSRELADSAYNERRAQCEEACRVLGVPKLRDADMERLLEAKSRTSEVVFRRARHVITENDRCRQFIEAAGRGEVAALGDLLRGSHASLRDDFEVSCFELDAMSDAANAAPGCIGARMTGAGFGGACVALVREAEFDAFSAQTSSAYAAATGREGEILACRVVDGAHIA